MSSLPSSQFIWFVRTLAELWPENMTPTEFLSAFPSHSDSLHKYEARLTDELWEIVRSDIDAHIYFGIACDGGIDHYMI